MQILSSTNDPLQALYQRVTTQLEFNISAHISSSSAPFSEPTLEVVICNYAERRAVYSDLRGDCKAATNGSGRG